MRKQRGKKLVLSIWALMLLGLFGVFGQSVQAANPATVNFQGKVTNADGTNVTNGSYSFVFRLYDTSSPTTTGTCASNGGCWWEETDSLTVTNGVFQVELGSGCAFTSACSSSHSGIDFNTNNSLYLTFKFNSDAAGFMSPTMHLTSVPYALNSDKLGGLTSGNFVQLGQGLQTDASTTNPSIYINKTNASGSPNILQLQKSGADVFTIDNTGLATALQGLTITTSKSLTVNGDAFTDLTGNGLTISSGSLGVGTDALDFTELKDALVLDASTTLGFGASNFGLTFTDNGSADFTVNLSSTGDFVVQDNGSAVFRVNDDGSALFQSSTASQSAFGVNNTSGLSVFGVNTLGASSGSNEIGNPSFELNVNGWSSKGAATLGPTWDNSTANFGSASLKFQPGATAVGASYNFPFKSSTQYTVSFYAKVSLAQTFVIGRQDNGSSDTDCGANISVTTSYQQFSCTFTTGTVSGASNLYVKQVGAGTPTINIDGITLVESSTALAFSSPASGLQIDADTNTLSLNASLDPDMTPWQSSGNSLPSGRRGATSATANGYIYYVGGTTANGATGAPVTTVNFAKINNDGSTGSWSAAANTLPVALYGHSSIVANGYLYVIGGCSDSSVTAACTTPVSTVYYTKLNSDGTVGTWQTNTFPLGSPTPGTVTRGYGAAISTGGFVYYLGGITTGPATSNAVYSAKLNGDGSISGWTNTSVTAMTTARYGFTAVTANGNIYTIGGCTDTAGTCSTASTAVEYAAPTSTGTLGSWAAAASLATATGFQSSAIHNGYIYNFGGRQAGSPVAAVNFAKLNGASTSPIGNWSSTGITQLPSVRQQVAAMSTGGYTYLLGGFDGTNLPVTALFAGGARTLVFGTLDLVGLTSQSYSDAGGGGNIIAGSIRSVGDLRVDGFADFNNGLSVDSAININAVSATAGQNVFNINNNLSNSIFNIKHMGTNFGSLVTGGAFIAKNSYFGEEFNVTQATNTTLTGTGANTAVTCSWARGDTGGHLTAANAACSATANSNSGTGELSLGENHGATGDQCIPSQVAGVNGVERITETATTTAHTAQCAEFLTGAGGAGALATNYASANLPIITMKVKPSTLPNSSNNRVYVGLFGQGATAGVPNAVPGSAASTGGVYFTNCSATTPTCANTTWYGWVINAGTATIVTCPGTLSTTNFAYLKIEFRTSTEVHFYIDVNASDGINEVECGTGATTNVPSINMAPWMETATGAASITTALDMDYYRAWQDDNLPGLETTTTQSSDTTVSASDTANALALDTATPADASNFLNFNAATSEDTAFNKDVYVKGTLYAEKIKANQIEGIELLTDKISSLQNSLAHDKAVSTPTNTSTGISTADQAGLSNIQAVNLVALAQLESRGGLVVDKDAQFNGKTIFQLLAEFNGNVNFNRQVTFNNDVGGTALIKKGAQKVQVKFGTPYAQTPVIVASWATDSDKSDDQLAMFEAGYNFLVTKADQNGFWIYLNKPAAGDVKLNWLATAIKDAKITTSEPIE